jgi:hypothetical protein
MDAGRAGAGRSRWAPPTPAIRAIWVTDTLPQLPPSGPPRSVVSVAPIIVAALERLRHASGPSQSETGADGGFPPQR